MSLHCAKKPWLPKMFDYFRLYTTIPCPHMSAQLLNHLKHNRLQQAHVMISKQTAPVPVHFYNYLLKGYAKNILKANNFEKSLNVLKEMKSKGVEPSSQSYMQLIMGLALRVTPLNKAEEKWMQKWFDEFIRIESGNIYPQKLHNKFKKLMRCVYYKGHPNLKSIFYNVLDVFKDKKINDSETWNLVLAGCIQSRKIKDAEEVLERARIEKVANSTSFQIVIKGYLIKGDQLSAHRVFRRMLQDDIIADKSTYETFLHYYLTQDKKNSVETLKRLWQGILMTTEEGKMIEMENVISLTGYYRRCGALEEAEQMYLDLKYRKQALNEAYLKELNQLIIQFTDKRQYISAVSLYFDLVGQGHTLNPKTIEHITRSFNTSSQFETVEQLMSVIPLVKHKE